MTVTFESVFCIKRRNRVPSMAMKSVCLPNYTAWTMAWTRVGLFCWIKFIRCRKVVFWHLLFEEINMFVVITYQLNESLQHCYVCSKLKRAASDTVQYSVTGAEVGDKHYRLSCLYCIGLLLLAVRHSCVLIVRLFTINKQTNKKQHRQGNTNK